MAHVCVVLRGYPANKVPAALQSPATSGLPVAPQPAGGTYVGFKVGLWALVSSELTPFPPDPPLCHLTFCFIGSSLQ